MYLPSPPVILNMSSHSITRTLLEPSFYPTFTALVLGTHWHRSLMHLRPLYVVLAI